MQLSFDLYPADHFTKKLIKDGSIKNSIKIEKDDSGKARRYLYGTSSGSLYRDAHNERMTERCVKGFVEQSYEKTLYIIHPHTDDIISSHVGILVPEKSYLTDFWEWIICARLWDQSDKGAVPDHNIAKAMDIWNMLSMNPPYDRKPVISQLSIQGTLDERVDIIETAMGRDLDWVNLGAISLVPTGAYPQKNVTIAQKIFKQVDQVNLKKSYNYILSKVKEDTGVEDFYLNSMKLDDALRELVREVLVDENTDSNTKEQKLKEIFTQYQDEYFKNFKAINFNLEDETMPRKANNMVPEEEADLEVVDTTPEDASKEDVSTDDDYEKRKTSYELVEVEPKQKSVEEMTDEELEEILEQRKSKNTGVKKEDEKPSVDPEMIEAIVENVLAKMGVGKGSIKAKKKSDDGEDVEGVIDTKTMKSEVEPRDEEGENSFEGSELDEILDALLSKTKGKVPTAIKEQLMNIAKESKIPSWARDKFDRLERENSNLSKLLKSAQSQLDDLYKGIESASGQDIYQRPIQKASSNQESDMEVIARALMNTQTFQNKVAKGNGRTYDNPFFGDHTALNNAHEVQKNNNPIRKFDAGLKEFYGFGGHK